MISLKTSNAYGHPKKDDPILAPNHISNEVLEARKLWKVISSNDLDTAITILKKKLCYNTSSLYALCSWFKPRIVVETGVWFGASSSFILAALSDNGGGRLYSIDLPSVTYNVDDKCKIKGKKVQSDIISGGLEPGFAIPKELRGNWTLIKGDAKIELPKLMHSISNIDLFHHDSLHTYEHMWFEYNTIWPKLNEGGILASDDVDWNDAFINFCNSVGAKAHIFGSTGYAIKEKQA